MLEADHQEYPKQSRERELVKILYRILISSFSPSSSFLHAGYHMSPVTFLLRSASTSLRQGGAGVFMDSQ